MFHPLNSVLKKVTLRSSINSTLETLKKKKPVLTENVRDLIQVARAHKPEFKNKLVPE